MVTGPGGPTCRRTRAALVRLDGGPQSVPYRRRRARGRRRLVRVVTTSVESRAGIALAQMNAGRWHPDRQTATRPGERTTDEPARDSRRRPLSAMRRWPSRWPIWSSATRRLPVDSLAGVSFQVRRGEVFGFLGPNGAGKTTTIGILTTRIRPTRGRALRGRRRRGRRPGGGGAGCSAWCPRSTISTARSRCARTSSSTPATTGCPRARRTELADGLLDQFGLADRPGWTPRRLLGRADPDG
jgi:hypothetical protein